MKYAKNAQNGYIGLIALLIVVLIIAFMMVKQVDYFGFQYLRNNATSTNNFSNGVDAEESRSVTPIQGAQNAKKIIESHDQNLLNQIQ